MRFYIGTSGWSYKDWAEFYPKGVGSKDLLSFYATQLNSVEVNVSFYRMVHAQTFANWSHTTVNTPEFKFSVKLLKDFTRDKKLHLNADDTTVLRQFLENASALGDALGPVLIQLPPSMHVNLPVVKSFLDVAQQLQADLPNRIRFAVEFRHESWLQSEMYALLRNYNVALVASDSVQWPTKFIRTTDFLYVRLHGKPRMFYSLYSNEELQALYHALQELNVPEVYIYFNNTMKGHAAQNALALQSIVSRVL